jgi:hypothetical protein
MALRYTQAVPQYRILKQSHTVEIGYDVIVGTE